MEEKPPPPPPPHKEKKSQRDTYMMKKDSHKEKNGVKRPPNGEKAARGPQNSEKLFFLYFRGGGWRVPTLAPLPVGNNVSILILYQCVYDHKQ